MRNLCVQDLQVKLPPDVTSEDGNGLFTIDSDSETVYFSPGSSSVINVVCLRSNQTIAMVDLDSEGYGGTEIIHLHYRLDEMALCIITRSGVMFSWSASDSLVFISDIGEEELVAAQWSPDGEILVAMSSSLVYVLVCHGNELDYVANFPFTQTHFGEAENINVGWGKKETQFHGSAGKQAAIQKKTVEVKLADGDDRKSRIRWIGDGQYFVISSIESNEDVRKLRVWSRDGTLYSTSETISGLESSLAWRPSGNLIASSQTDKNRHQIIFFERNGLRHGEFTLPYDINKVQVREVEWNTLSDILCVWLIHQDKSHSVQLWTINNYHWYLKKSIPFTDSQKVPVQVVWDIMESYKLHILTQDGRLIQYTLYWVVNKHNKNNHEVAVIDSDKLLISTFKTMVVPPPMCSYQIKLPGHIDQVIFSRTTNQLAVVLANRQLHIYNLDSDKLSDTVTLQAAGGTGFLSKCSIANFHRSVMLPDGSFYHAIWPQEDVICLITSEPGEKIKLLHLQLVDDGIEVITEKAVSNNVISVCNSEDSVLLQYNNGKMWKYQLTTRELIQYHLSNGTQLIFPVCCPYISACTFSNQECIVGMSTQFRLFVNDYELANNCTSFTVHNDFLLVTTHSHTIRCISRTATLNQLKSISDSKTHIFDETVRNVERGSKLVTCITNNTQVILQMPRGNIELIHPRALVLSTVRVYLNRLEYKEAFMLCYRHRINMNVLSDHDLKLFLENIQTFIKQISNITHLNQFITELSSADVTHTMYTAYYTQRSEHTVNNKVNVICDALITAFNEMDSDKHLLCVLTAHCRKQEPELQVALKKISNLTDNNRQEEALKYLMYLVDVNELYDVALSSYDFNLVLLVAEKSQKDPKEYLIFLNEVRQMEPNYQKFYIDRHLKNYKRALTNIVKCVPEKFSEMMSLVQQHSLYLDALQLLERGSQPHKEVVLAFAEFLQKKRKYVEAGKMYMQAETYSEALECFQEGAQWNEAVVCVAKLDLPTTKRLEIYKTLAGKLVSSRQHSEAAVLMETYAEQPEEAISILITGSLWSSALRLIEKYGRDDFLETDWIPAVNTSYTDTISSLEHDRHELVKYNERYLEVLKINQTKHELIDGEYRDVDADIYSDTSSVTGVSTTSSSHSRSTGRTSKNIRKAQRKKWSLKEGSKFEDLALLDELKKLITRLDSLRGEIHELLLALIHIHSLSRAVNLQIEYDICMNTVLDVIPQIWTDTLCNNVQISGEHMTTNSLIQSMASLHMSNFNPGATQAEVEVKRRPVFSTDSTWKLSMLQSSFKE